MHTLESPYTEYKANARELNKYGRCTVLGNVDNSSQVKVVGKCVFVRMESMKKGHRPRLPQARKSGVGMGVVGCRVSA